MVIMTRPHRTLNILMNGLLVGHLKKKMSGALTFTYTKSWIKTPGARPISLSLPLLEQPFTGDVVYHFFDNLLPESPKLRARIQAHFQLPSNHPFDLLKIIGKECIGAIQCVPGRVPVFNKKIRFEALGEAGVAMRLRNLNDHPLGMTPGLDTFCLSLSGTTPKAAFLYHQDVWSRPRDKTPTSHILKHYKAEDTQAENSWLCSKIAEAFGLPVAESHLVYFEEIKTLVIKRFDRQYAQDGSWLMRRPQEDLCQALGVSSRSKYTAKGGPGIQTIMKFLLGSANPIHDRDVFYCSQVLFWLLAHTTGHAKNFSVFIQPEGKYRLTPLYDIQSAYPSLNQNQASKENLTLAMPLYNKPTQTYTRTHWHTLERQHILETAKAMHYSVDRARAILDDMLSRIDAVIEHVEAQLPPHFPSNISQPIFDGMRAIKHTLTCLESTSTRSHV